MNGFAEAVLPYQGQLLGHALYMCRNRADAEDLVQETLLLATIAWPSFQQGTDERAWLYTIMTRAFIGMWRKRKVRSRAAQDRPLDIMTAMYNAVPTRVHVTKRGTGPETSHPTHENAQSFMTMHSEPEANALVENALADEVRAALAQLGPELFEVLNRHTLKGEMVDDIAADLKLPPGTVMTRLHRARRQLQGKLADFAACEYGIKKR